MIQAAKPRGDLWAGPRDGRQPAGSAPAVAAAGGACGVGFFRARRLLATTGLSDRPRPGGGMVSAAAGR